MRRNIVRFAAPRYTHVSARSIVVNRTPIAKRVFHTTPKYTAPCRDYTDMEEVEMIAKDLDTANAKKHDLGIKLDKASTLLYKYSVGTTLDHDDLATQKELLEYHLIHRQQQHKLWLNNMRPIIISLQELKAKNSGNPRLLMEINSIEQDYHQFKNLTDMQLMEHKNF